MRPVPIAQLPILRDASLFASGSRALAELLAWGAIEHGWRRAWLPSYYCPDVPAAVAEALPTLELRSYPDHVLWAAPALGLVTAAPGDVVVVANQLGIRPRPAAAVPPGVALVEDHSHDMGSEWAMSSRAHYAFASLRKTLPIPDGGAVWSPLGLPLPPEPAPAEADATAAFALAAMLQRRLERAAEADDAIPFRALARSAIGRAGVSARAISPVSRSLLPYMPADAWRGARRRNFELLTGAVPLRDGVRLLLPQPGGAAFAFTLVFDDPAQREVAMRALVARAVAPVVLWPLDPAVHAGTGAADANLARRILSVNCDQRFSVTDMDALAIALREAL